jgi:quinol monooxygenase YgiN
MAGRSGLDQAAFIICSELVTIHIAEVNLYSRQSACKPLENAVHSGSNTADHLAVYQHVLVTVDLNLHAPPLFPPRFRHGQFSIIYIHDSIPAAVVLLLSCAILVVMEIGRRGLVSGAVAIVLGRLASAAPVEAQQMYGLIGSMSAVSGRRDDVIAILTEAVSNMPGCLSYVLAKDSEDENTIWVTEVWDNKESHDASLSLPSVTKAISAARPMISAFGNQVITTPVGGYGLPATKPH